MQTDRGGYKLRLVPRPDAGADARALLHAGLDVAYQPIVHLGSGSVIAYEALARPRHPQFPGPLDFFVALDGAGLRVPGERLAFQQALNGLEGAQRGAKLFVNASPSTLLDPGFDVGEVIELVEQHGLFPGDVVVEVTESEAVHDVEALAERARHLARLGVGLAVDDAGAGHASFRVITRLRPAFIKLDRDLVNGVDADGARHAFIEAMVRFSQQIGSRLIAEGIETGNELASLAGLGVEAGQGYYLAPPVTGEFPVPSPQSRRTIASTVQRLRLGAARVTIGEIARPAAVVAADLTVRQAYARFQADPSLGILAITDGGCRRRLRAQLTRRALERCLAGPGAWDALADQPIGDLADHHPAAVVEHRDLVDVGAMVAARERHEIAEDLLVTDARGRLTGIAALRDVMRALTDVRGTGVEELHPLSGLHGPMWLERELARRLEAGTVVTVLCCDIDRLRAVNDAGGFALGDALIRALARCLQAVACAEQDTAVAHGGGGDFLLLCPPDRLEALLSALVDRFEREVLGGLRSELRRLRGTEPEPGLSLAAVDLVGGPPAGMRHLDWVRSRLTRPMLAAKEQNGYACVHATDAGLRSVSGGDLGQRRADSA